MPALAKGETLLAVFLEECSTRLQALLVLLQAVRKLHSPNRTLLSWNEELGAVGAYIHLL